MNKPNIYLIFTFLLLGVFSFSQSLSVSELIEYKKYNNLELFEQQVSKLGFSFETNKNEIVFSRSVNIDKESFFNEEGVFIHNQKEKNNIIAYSMYYSGGENILVSDKIKSILEQYIKAFQQEKFVYNTEEVDKEGNIRYLFLHNTDSLVGDLFFHVIGGMYIITISIYSV